MIREIHSDRLFIGNAMDARDLGLLHDHRIAAVVDLAAKESPALLARDMICCRFPLIDGDGNADEVIEAAIRCVITLMQNETRTMVACSAGMSRSLAIAAVAIAIVTGKPAEDCLRAIAVGAPHDVSPLLWSHVKSVYNEVVQDSGHALRTDVDEPSDEPERKRRSGSG